ncbi:hypothetical protein JAAARDRAFT_208830 [Jaapia argillacea MUCL 33604]|uniref:FAD dependent oxidoreductase domain-containing protein n=1 Tax=Jaapia argillacea MUCL 33604 TaxID=933084 RepID=A0A067PJJ6_9AGAM|nr:hypothetical protein JAAARDRAFT_208830 [Jaapia argillacea MUCL 33604]
MSQVFLTKVGQELHLNHGLYVPESKGLRVLIVGGGVTGMTTAWALLDAGYDVTIISSKWASLEDRITSQIAGALWEWPPAVCGQHTNPISLENSKVWCMTSYRALDELMKALPAEEHGVRMRTANFFFCDPVETMPGQLKKMVEIEAVSDIQGFYRDPTLITQHAVNQNAGVVDAYKHDAPVIDTDHYMTWIRQVILSKGARLVTETVTEDLINIEDSLRLKYNAFAIVNATGLSGDVVAGDNTVSPLRGALIRVVNDGKKFPIVKEALCVSHMDNAGEDVDDIVFIVPRNDRVLILGGIAQPNKHTLDLTIDSPEIIRMRERCNNFVPGLADAELDATPFVQGLRPLRDHNVRVEREQRSRRNGMASRVVHSYGHGGSGFSLSFGCAGDVLGLVDEILAEVSDTVEHETAIVAHL